MQFKTPFLLSLLFLISTISYAQRNCGSTDYLQQQVIDNPQRGENLKQIEAHTQDWIKAHADDDLTKMNTVITIPVVVHVVYKNGNENISDAQIATQLQVLNEDFRRLNSDADNTWSQAADIEIEFCMATVDPNGNSTNGITRTSTTKSVFTDNDHVKLTNQGGQNAWPSADYMNIWVCALDGFLGYAQFPGGPASTDGVVCDYRYFGTNGTAQAPFDLGRTATHEVGHYLNLYHIWGDGACGQDDEVNDTPASDAPNYGCANGHTSCGSTDMIQNYMDYSDDGCMNLFTLGQKNRMRALFDAGGFRTSLVNSTACGATPPTATCNDGIQNQGETGVDCGGPCAPCATPPTCNDGIQNQGETGVDCGGPCAPCATPPTCNDGIQNQGETGVDCGGPCAPCASTPTCNDGIQNQGETGVDCGGPCAPCASTPTCNDGIQNQGETGVDCGGPCTPCNAGCNDNSATLTITPDAYGSEITWNIKSGNTILYSGGPYNNGNNGMITIPLCFLDGCYTFTIADSYGDGICCAYGTGSYSITNANGNVLASGGDYGDGETKEICFDNGPNIIGGDAGINNIYGPKGNICGDVIRPRVRIKNYDNTPLTFVTIVYTVDNGNPITYNWTGNLAAGAQKVINLNHSEVTPGNHTFKAYTINPNGGFDSNISNDSQSRNFKTSGSDSELVRIQIKPDNYGGDITWELVNNNGTVVSQGGPYADGDTDIKRKNVCLPYGCYTFNIYDSYGDGICCEYGNGFYRIRQSNGEIIVNSNGQYGSSESQSFCINDNTRSALETITTEKTGPEIELYPNPANDMVNLELTNIPMDGQIQLVSLLGQVLKTIDIEATPKSTYSIDVSNLQSGLYIISYDDGRKKIFKRLSVTH